MGKKKGYRKVQIESNTNQIEFWKYPDLHVFQIVIDSIYALLVVLDVVGWSGIYLQNFAFLMFHNGIKYN